MGTVSVAMSPAYKPRALNRKRVPGMSKQDDVSTEPAARRREKRQPHSHHTRNPLLSAVLAQLLGALAAGGLALAFFPPSFVQPLAIAALQGSCALVAAWRLRARAWWLPIHLVFMPLVVLARGMDLPSWLWASGFLLLLLIFWRTDTSQVPLYLTNRKSRYAVLSVLPATPCRVIDLGCGDGALLRHLARSRPDCTFVGFEHAPLTWAWARLSTHGLANVDIRRGDFWTHPLAGYDLVYAFLSPAPMARLWAKARAEMSPGARLVSNSFVVPEQAPLAVVDVDDKRRTRLNIYIGASLPG
ncbi:MAG: methyltransferase domain-containing protein [Azonexus sp.]|jgi:precorrin-6B methylase 2|nr:methyltransferase domain-containing protein [Azonexus sp.]